jgi:hypothetical protein
MKPQSKSFTRFFRLVIACGVFLGVALPGGIAHGSLTNSEETESLIRNCVSQSGHLAALFLIDESSSLRESDPSNLRVAALKAAVAALTFNINQKTISGENYKIEVAFAGFGKSYVKESSWFELSENQDEKLNQIINSFEKRNTQRGTNYLEGLVNAQNVLNKKALEDPGVCKVLVWLSDGKLYINGEENSETQQAEKDLCSTADGVADQLRSQKVFLVGFGLSGIGADNDVDFSLMQGITDGSIDCGDRPGYGIFEKVQSADGLIASLFNNLSPFPTDPEQPLPCRSDPSNPECREVVFQTRPPLDRIKFLMSTSEGINSVEVIEPSGTSTQIIDETGLVATSSEVVLTEPLYDFASIVSINFEAATQPYGEWTIRFVGPNAAKAFVSAVFFSDVLAELVSGDSVILNREDLQPIQIKLEEFGTNGLTTEADGVSSVGFDSNPTINAELVFGSTIKPVQTVLVDPVNGIFEIQLSESDISDLPSLGKLSLEPVAMLSGHKIGFATSTFDVQLRLGDGMPNVVSATATDINDDEKSTVTFVIEGPKEGSGTFRIADSVQIMENPTSDLDSQIQILGAGEAQEIAQGESKTFKVELNPSFTANGNVVVKLEVELSGEGGNSQTVPVEIDFSMSRPFKTTTFVKWSTFMAMGFLALQTVLIMLAGLLLARLNSRPSYTKFASGRIDFSADGTVSLEGGRISDIGNNWHHLGSERKSSASYSIGGIEFRMFAKDAVKTLFKPQRLQVHAKANPGEVSEIAVGDSGFALRDKEIWGICRTSVEKSWVLVFDAASASSALASQTPLSGVLHCVFPDQDSVDSPYSMVLEAEISMALIRDKVKTALSQLPGALPVPVGVATTAGEDVGSGPWGPSEGSTSEYD